MEPVVLWLLATAVSLLVLYLVIRKAVHHGIQDAEADRAARAQRAELARVRRERPSRYVEHDPDV